ncbi:BamA/OMP85 family outer membrane protein [Deinococcus cellulosilyticus]|uniref:Outer membrane protein n=1 Tax=Deinococcus cellulosilyticus (strain DSM 18568 / NBRC 106333 / KACC 11606 / 5516J-15) TaxID=1223518 RepID=A0A511N8L3_DEIC1|nr:POTRA domain-containing protein [Deinococcus cellulosilyticus]GEM49193.1 outer membrane protein [Deinococcus cellulosilyticus NBRC 106333 = KACC 11606]
MRKRLALTLALLSVPALAQQQGTLSEIRVQGADDLLSSLIKIELPFVIGDPISKVDPKLAELAVEGLGFFKSVDARLLEESGQTILVVQVEANPTITQVEIKGNTLVQSSQIQALLENQLNISAGTTLNTLRVDQSRQLLSEGYRQAGLPFAPKVQTDLAVDKDGVKLTYTIDETAPIESVKVTGNTLVTDEELQQAVAPLVQAKTFTMQVYQQALQNIANLYSRKGYQGSGPNVSGAELAGNVLTIQVRELKIGSIDTSNLGEGVQLTSKPGDFLNTQKLLDDVRAQGNRLGKYVSVEYQQDPTEPATVNVSFVLSDQATGKVEKIVINNETALTEEELRPLLRLKAGDQFNLELAQNDYMAMQRAYREKGFELVTQPNPIDFDGTTLTFNLRELRIGGYELEWKGDHRSQERLVLRELPPAGSAFNKDIFNKSLERLIRTGYVAPPEVLTKVNPEDPNSAIFVLKLTENSNRYFSPAIEYNSLGGGWSGSLAYEDNNFFGTGHSASAQVSASLNEANQPFNGQLSYSIPWLDFDFLDFATTPTSASLSVYSMVTPNLPIKRTVPGTTDTEDTGRQYSERATGFSVNLGRPITPELRVSLGYSMEWTQAYLERRAAGEGGLPDNDPDLVASFPPNGQNSQVYSNLSFDNTNFPEFPSSGFRASLGASYGFGYTGSTRLNWWQLTGGGRSYFGFGNKMDNGMDQFAVALRANAGTILGSAPASRTFVIGGSEPSDRFTLRGYDNKAFTGSNYFTASTELRYNTGLSTGFSQGLYGVAFVDVGDAWTKSSEFKVNVGYGLGVQLNLGTSSFLLPAIRLDYGFSPVNPKGKFHFRLGSFF